MKHGFRKASLDENDIEKLAARANLPLLPGDARALAATLERIGPAIDRLRAALTDPQFMNLGLPFDEDPTRDDPLA